MSNTSRVKWPKPTPHEGLFIDTFDGFADAADATAYANREDRNTVLMGGGTISFTASTGVLSWSTDLELLCGPQGVLWKVPAGNVTLADGQVFYVELVRAATATTSLTATVAGRVPSDDDSYLLAVRRDDRVYFRTGDVIIDGLPRVMLASDLIVNADVSATAAIAGYKINPAFGAQMISSSTGIVIDNAGGIVLQATTGNGSAKAMTMVGQKEMSTTDATPTALWTYTPPTNCTVRVYATVNADKSDGSDDYGVDLVAAFRVASGVVTTRMASTKSAEVTAAAAIPTPVIDTSGGIIRLMITGIAAQTWRWGTNLTVVVRENAA